MKAIHVRVEEYHIKCGFANSGTLCPVALALTPRLPAGQSAIVGRGFFSVWQGSISEQGALLLGTYDLPDEVTRFVRKFDSGEKVEPIEFDVTPDMETL